MAITYTVATNIITVTGYTEATPCNFTDIYNADKAGTLSLHARTGITAVDGAAVAVDRAERPADYIVLGGASNDLYITIANWVGTTATIQITGTDRDGTAQTEDIVVTANGNYFTTKWFKTITHTQVTVFTATGFDYDLTQGQWGVIFFDGTNQFKTDALISVGDGTIETHFAEKSKQIILNVNLTPCFSIKSNGYCTFGELVSESLKLGKNGCSIINKYLLKHITADSGSYVYFYNTRVESAVRYYITRFWGGMCFQILDPINTDIYRVTILNSGYSLRNPTNIIGDDLLMYSNTYALFLSGDNKIITLSNVIMELSATTNIRTFNFGVDVASTAYIINGDCAWTFTWSGSALATVYRQYELDLKIIDKDNTPIQTATVKIWDKDSNLIVDTTTDANGDIATQTISRGYYNQANGNTLQEYSPHTIQISKAGYKTYQTKFILDKKTDYAISLARVLDNNFSKRIKINTK